MRPICLGLVVFIGLSNHSLAENSLLKTTIDVDIAGRSIATPLELTGDQQGNSFIVSAQADISDLSIHAAAALQDAINRKGDCEQRWSAWDTQAAVSGDALSVVSIIRVEQWLCKKVLGTEVKTKLGRETGRVEAHVTPLIADGRPQLKLAHFRIHDLGPVAKALGVESFVRRELEKEIDKINANPKLTEAPSVFGQSGYRYHQAEVRRGPDNRSYLAASIIGPNDALALAKLIAALSELIE